MTIKSITQLMDTITREADETNTINFSTMPEEVAKDIEDFFNQAMVKGHDKLDVMFPDPKDFSMFMNTVRMAGVAGNIVAAALIRQEIFVRITQYLVGLFILEDMFKDDFYE